MTLAWPEPLGFPAMQHEVTSVSVGVLVPVTDRIRLRLFDLYERGNLRDWHYEGFGAQRSIDHRVYVDGGPEDYSDNIVGVLLQIRL